MHDVRAKLKYSFFGEATRGDSCTAPQRQKQETAAGFREYNYSDCDYGVPCEDGRGSVWRVEATVWSRCSEERVEWRVEECREWVRSTCGWSAVRGRT